MEETYNSGSGSGCWHVSGRCIDAPSKSLLAGYFSPWRYLPRRVHDESGLSGSHMAAMHLVNGEWAGQMCVRGGRCHVQIEGEMEREGLHSGSHRGWRLLWLGVGRRRRNYVRHVSFQRWELPNQEKNCLM